MREHLAPVGMRRDEDANRAGRRRRRTRRRLIASLVALVATGAAVAASLLVSEGEGGESVSGNSESCPQPPAAVSPPTGIRMSLRVDPTQVSRGGSVAASLELENTRSEAFTISQGGLPYDFWVVDADGDLIWMWSEEERRQGRFFQDVLSFESVEAGQARTVTTTWDGSAICRGTADPAPTGRYEMRAAWRNVERGSGELRVYEVPAAEFVVS